jgi:hypothetical protein
MPTFTLRRGLIKYGKINGIIPMKSVNPNLVAHKKLAIVVELDAIFASHN